MNFICREHGKIDSIVCKCGLFAKILYDTKEEKEVIERMYNEFLDKALVISYVAQDEIRIMNNMIRLGLVEKKKRKYYKVDHKAWNAIVAAFHQYNHV